MDISNFNNKLSNFTHNYCFLKDYLHKASFREFQFGTSTQGIGTKSFCFLYHVFCSQQKKNFSFDNFPCKDFYMMNQPLKLTLDFSTL